MNQSTNQTPKSNSAFSALYSKKQILYLRNTIPIHPTICHPTHLHTHLTRNQLHGLGALGAPETRIVATRGCVFRCFLALPPDHRFFHIFRLAQVQSA